VFAAPTAAHETNGWSNRARRTPVAFGMCRCALRIASWRRRPCVFGCYYIVSEPWQESHAVVSFYYSPFVGRQHAVASSSLPGAIFHCRSSQSIGGMSLSPVTMAGRPPCCQLAIGESGEAGRHGHCGHWPRCSLCRLPFIGAFRVVHTAYFRPDTYVGRAFGPLQPR